MHKSLYYVFFSIFIFCTSCSSTDDKGKTFIGGQIVNPVEPYLTILKDESVLDTVYLDSLNRFSYSFPKNTQGLFRFRHAPESQLFYIEEGDSLLLRVNTIEFDESLMYSGEGAEANNFLMEMYLLNEKNNDLIFSYYKISPTEFTQKTDSIKQVREKRLNRLTKEHSFSADFEDLAQKTINYEYYDLRERYAFLINKYLEDYRDELPKGFFNYRKYVDFNDEELQSHYTYQRFLDNYLKNRSIQYCIKHDLDRDCFSLNDIDNLTRRLKIADSIFSIPQLKNRFLNRFARKEIIFSEHQDQIDTTFYLLKQFEFPEDMLSDLQTLANIQASYFLGKNLGQKTILNTEAKHTTIKKVINKPSIVYVWSIYSSVHHKIQHQKINNLRNRYPEIDFIGINVDQGETQLWLRTLENFDYPKKYEYQIRGRDKSTIPYYRNYLNKIFFVDKNSVIIQGQVRLEDSDLEQKILEFLNR